MCGPCSVVYPILVICAIMIQWGNGVKLLSVWNICQYVVTQPLSGLLTLNHIHSSCGYFDFAGLVETTYRSLSFSAFVSCVLLSSSI